ALAHAQYAELIPDLLHVHPGAIRVALRAIPHLYCVTDSTAAASMPDGEYQLGRQRVIKCMGGVRLPDGTLAGSTLTMDQALREPPPKALLTVARGSSGDAALFMAYLIMARLGRLVTSLPMSIVTLYQSQIDCDGLVAFAFSQSGQSPDLVAPMRFFQSGGA